MDRLTFWLLMTSVRKMGNTMLAGQDSSEIQSGFESVNAASVLGDEAFGSVSSQATGFGTLEGLVTPNGGGGLLVLSSATGTPSSVTINGTSHSLSFAYDYLGFHFYEANTVPVFVNGNTYTWSLA